MYRQFLTQDNKEASDFNFFFFPAKFKNMYLFTFGLAGSLLLRRLFSGCGEQGCAGAPLQLQGMGCLLQQLLLWCVGSRVCGLW